MILSSTKTRRRRAHSEAVRILAEFEAVLYAHARGTSTKPGRVRIAVNYYVLKTSIFLENLFEQCNAFGGTVLTNASRRLTDYRGVLFLFDDQRLMHVGDQFFFKPLITKLAASGFRVRVRPSPSLKFFFSRHLENAGEDLTSFLVVTRTDMYPSIRRTPGINRAHFLYNTKSTQIASPVSNHIVDTFCEYFGLGSDSSVITTADYIDFPVGEESFGLSEKPSLLFFNNYVDSGRYRVWGGVGRRLLERVRESKEEGFIVHLGSAGDKARDGSDYRGLVDLDLRGRTSPQDLFSILSLPNVRRVFCHDTAILHIANLYDKPVSVAFRRFFRRGENQQKRRAYASLYRKDLSNFEFLD